MGDKVKQRKKKKPNKRQRDERRAHDADLFNEAFSMGWLAAEKHYIRQFDSERKKWALRGT
jgi:hypothetical protein